MPFFYTLSESSVSIESHPVHCRIFRNVFLGIPSFALSSDKDLIEPLDLPLALLQDEFRDAAIIVLELVAVVDGHSENVAHEDPDVALVAEEDVRSFELLELAEKFILAAHDFLAIFPAGEAAILAVAEKIIPEFGIGSLDLFIGHRLDEAVVDLVEAFIDVDGKPPFVGERFCRLLDPQILARVDAIDPLAREVVDQDFRLRPAVTREWRIRVAKRGIHGRGRFFFAVADNIEFHLLSNV